MKPMIVPTPDERQLAKIVEGWLSTLAARSDATARRYLAAVRMAMPEIGAMGGLGSVTPSEASRVYRRIVEKHGPATANVVASALSAMWFHIAKTTGIDLPNPWRGLRRARPKDTLAERILEEQDVEAMVKTAAPGVERALIRLLYYTGCRISEAVALTWRDVHPDKEGFAVTVYGKRQKTRTVHLPSHLYKELVELKQGRNAPLVPGPDGRPMTRFDAYRIIKRVARRAGLTKIISPKISPHWLRHSHATHALDRGAPIQQVQATLGHASIATTARYLHVRPGKSSGDVLPEF